METLFLRDVGICITVAAGLAVVSSFLGQPILIAYLAAGVILGPSGLHLINNDHNIKLISQIGLILLMFILGQEIHLSRLIRSGRSVLVAGITQFLLCFGVGWLLFWSLGFKQGHGHFDRFYLSYAFALSSTMVVIKILSDRFDIDTLVSRITIGILVIQDLWAIAFLSFQPNLLHPNALNILWSFTKGLVLVGTAFGTARFAMPPLFRRIHHQPEMVLMVAMGWCFAIVGLSHNLGLSKEMGALVAGVAVATFPFHIDVAAKISSLKDFFVTLFFVGLGLQIPIPTAENLKIAVIISVFIILSRLFSVFPVLYKIGFGVRGSFIPAINLSQISEFAPVMLALGVQYGHVSQESLSLILFVLVITIALSSYTIVKAHDLSQILGNVARWLNFKDSGALAGDGSRTDVRPTPKVIFLGFFRDASSLLYEWLASEPVEFREKILVLDYNPITQQKLKKLGIHSAYGDIGHPDVLFRNKAYDFSEVEVILCTIQDHTLKGTSNVRMLRWFRNKMPQVKIVMTAETFDQAKELYEHGADYVYLPRIIGARGILSAILALRTGDGERIKEAHLEELRERTEVLN